LHCSQRAETPQAHIVDNLAALEERHILDFVGGTDLDNLGIEGIYMAGQVDLELVVAAWFVGECLLCMAVAAAVAARVAVPAVVAFAAAAAGRLVSVHWVFLERVRGN